VRRLNLEPFARRRLDLQRGVVVDEDAAGLERAVVLEKDVHRRRKLRGDRTRIIPQRRRGDGARWRFASLCFSMAVFRRDAAIMSMLYRRLGDSGLEVSELCLGTMMFGDRTDAATAQRIVAS